MNPANQIKKCNEAPAFAVCTIAFLSLLFYLIIYNSISLGIISGIQ